MRSRTRGWVNATVECGFSRGARCLLLVIAFIAVLGAMMHVGPANARRARHAWPGARISSAHGFMMAVLRAQNGERRRHGLSSLGSANELDRAASRHVRDMVR